MTKDEFKNIRLKFNLTQPELARILGVCARTVWAMEKDRQKVNKITALAMTCVNDYGAKWRLNGSLKSE